MAPSTGSRGAGWTCAVELSGDRDARRIESRPRSGPKKPLEGIFTLAAQGFSVAFTAALVFVPICIALALRLGVVDKPGGRKTHERVTPLLGGVGIFLAATA